MMKKFQKVMFVIFSVLGVAGFIGMISVNEESPQWFTVLSITFAMFIVGVAGSAVFNDFPSAVLKLKEISCSVEKHILACIFLIVIFFNRRSRNTRKRAWAVSFINRYHTYSNLYQYFIRRYEKMYE